MNKCLYKSGVCNFMEIRIPGVNDSVNTSEDVKNCIEDIIEEQNFPLTLEDLAKLGKGDVIILLTKSVTTENFEDVMVHGHKMDIPYDPEHIRYSFKEFSLDEFKISKYKLKIIKGKFAFGSYDNREKHEIKYWSEVSGNIDSKKKSGVPTEFSIKRGDMYKVLSLIPRTKERFEKELSMTIKDEVRNLRQMKRDHLIEIIPAMKLIYRGLDYWGKIKHKKEIL